MLLEQIYNMRPSMVSSLIAAGCHRCKKPFRDDADDVCGFQEHMLSLRQAHRTRADYFAMDGGTLQTIRLTLYHPRCLPPYWYHKLSGSLPDSRFPSVQSLSNEHCADREASELVRVI